jgi:succinate dehydrogenase / fumarate reductase cytochrome b subunit
MSQTTLRRPTPYRPSLFTRLWEGLRYGGGIGQWSWLVHRVTGVGILLFLVIHIIDTFFVVAYPALYDHTVSIYGGMVTGLGPGVNGYYWGLRWAFRLGELGLIACVLFHAINGVRVILFDFWPRAVLYQKELAWAVLTIFAAIMIPVAVVVFLPLTKAPRHWTMPGADHVPARMASAAPERP